MKSDTKDNNVEIFELNYISDTDRINMEIQDYINSFGNFENVLSDEYLEFMKKNTDLLMQDLDTTIKSYKERENSDKLESEKANNEKDINKIKNIIDVLNNYNK